MPAHAAKQINRLSDFIIEEVSYVDRAANKRRFLQIKRDDAGEHAGTTQAIESDGRGGFRAAPIPDTTGAAARPPLDEEIKKTMTTTNVTKGIEAVEQIFFKFGDAVDRLMRVASVVLQADSLKLADGPNTSTVLAEIDTVKSVLEDIKSEIGVAKSLLATPSAADKAAATAATTKNDEAEKAVEALSLVADKLRTQTVEKQGAKMSAGRLVRFQNALKDLLGVLQDVGGDVKSLVKSEKAAPAAAPSKPAPVVAAPSPAGEAADLKKRFEDSQAEIVRLRKENTVLKASPSPPSSVTVEGSNFNPTASEDDFDWPMDMNKPLDKASVPVEKSFHG